MTNTQDTPEQFELMRSALSHIARTARRSRTSTRRLRWIEDRAEGALAGKPYVPMELDLPKNVENEYGKTLRLRFRLRESEAVTAALRSALERIVKADDANELTQADIERARAAVNAAIMNNELALVAPAPEVKR